MIYIDTGKIVKYYYTNRKTERAIETLLEQIDEMMFAETVEGCTVDIVKDKPKEWEA